MEVQTTQNKSNPVRNARINVYSIKLALSIRTYRGFLTLFGMTIIRCTQSDKSELEVPHFVRNDNYSMHSE